MLILIVYSVNEHRPALDYLRISLEHSHDAYNGFNIDVIILHADA